MLKLQAEQTEDAGVALAAARAAFGRGDHAAAIATLTAALDGLADDDPGLALAAQLYAQRGHSRFIRRDLPGATADYDRALALDPELADAYASRGLIAYQSGKAMGAVYDFDAALAVYERRAQLSAADRRAVAETLLNRGNAHYQLRGYDAAEHDYSAALILEPALVEALIFRGVARFQRGASAAAADDYRAALLHPAIDDAQRAQVLYNHGVLLRDAGELAAALAAYDAALELQPRDADCLMNRGNAHAERGDLPRAIADYDAALRLNPWIEDGFNIRGMARLTAGDLDGAVADFGQAITRNPRVLNAHFNRGCALLQRGDYAAAIEDFTAEIGMQAPGLKGRVETREKRAEILNNRGLAQHYLGQLDAAIADYERSLQQLRMVGGAAEIAERMASTLLNRGAAYRERAAACADDAGRAADLERAAADWEQALAIAPDPALAVDLRTLLHELRHADERRPPLYNRRE